MSSTRRPGNLRPAELLGRSVARGISSNPLPIVLLVHAAHLLAHLDNAPPEARADAEAARPEALQVLQAAAWALASSVPASLVAESVAALAGHGDTRAAARLLENIRAQSIGLDPEMPIA